MKHIISSRALYEVITREKRNSGSSFTIKSVSTGVDYTYKISRKLYNGVWYSHIAVETQYLNFKYLGYYKDGVIQLKGKTIDTPSAKAISFVLSKVEKQEFDWLDSKLNVMHTGHCLVCGKELTDSKSIERGLGDICAKQLKQLKIARV